MQVPIYIDGKKEGRLDIERQGNMTVMQARLRDVGRVVRLSVYGEREAYLGVPVPEEGSGEQVLTRRLSPNAMRSFPREPAYAAEHRSDRHGPAQAPGADRPKEYRREQREEARPEGKARHVLWHGGRPHYF